MANLNDFIQTYDNTITSDECEFLIGLFEQNPEKWGNDENSITFLCLTELRKYSEEIDKIHSKIIKNVFEYRDKYYEIFGTDVFPEKHAFEKFVIEKYEPSQDEIYETMVDIKEYDSARRFLSFTWFLNNNQAGQIEFLDLFIQPEAGRLLISPPFWMFPYRKHKPIEGPQYILKTYLHYK